MEWNEMKLKSPLWVGRGQGNQFSFGSASAMLKARCLN